MESLPKEFDSFPFNFTEEELSWLQGSPFLKIRLKENESARNNYDLICSRVAGFSDFSFKTYSDALLLASSRMFALNVRGQETSAMVPLADFINHRMPDTASWDYDADYDGFIMEAEEDIERGDEIYISYGSLSNASYFLYYGFTVPENVAFDEITLTVELDSNDPQVEQKKAIMGEHDERMEFKVRADFM